LTLIGAVFLIYTFLAMIYLGLMMVVLHTYETKHKRWPPVFFWEFRAELRREFPDATRWARAILILGFALTPVWFFGLT